MFCSHYTQLIKSRVENSVQLNFAQKISYQYKVYLKWKMVLLIDFTILDVAIILAVVEVFLGLHLLI